VAFRFVAGNTHPDHDTIASFRRRFADEIKAMFVQVLQIAQANGLLKLGNVALDGTKVKANASRHSALSHGHGLKLQEPLQAEVEALLRLAEAADSRIMKILGQGFEQCYNAQLAVDRESRLIVAPGLTQEVNDKQQLIPALEKLRALPPEWGTVQALVADSGFMNLVSGEWDLVCLVYNVKRMHRMQRT